MTGDEVRGATFQFQWHGYSPIEVDAWLHRVADLIDSGVALGSDYPREKFLKVMRGYDRRAVDRFTAALATGGVTADVLASPSAPSKSVRKTKAQPASLVYANAMSCRYRDGRDKPFRQQYRQECEAEWARFPGLAGSHLCQERRQVSDSDGRVLMSRDRRTLTDVSSAQSFRWMREKIVHDRTHELIVSSSGHHQSFEAGATVSLRGRGDRQP